MRKPSKPRRLVFAILIMALTLAGSQMVSAEQRAHGGGGNVTQIQMNPDHFAFFVNWIPANGDCRNGNPTGESIYYMSSSQPNYKQALAVVLVAYSMNRPIGFQYFEETTVTPDATPCAIDRVSLSR